MGNVAVFKMLPPFRDPTASRYRGSYFLSTLIRYIGTQIWDVLYRIVYHHTNVSHIFVVLPREALASPIFGNAKTGAFSI